MAGDGVALAAHGGQQLAEILRGGSPAPWIALLGRCLLETGRILRDDAVRVRGGGGRDAKARAGARDLTRGCGGGRCLARLSRRQGAARQPGRARRVAHQQEPVRLQFGVDVGEHLHRRLGPALRLLDLSCDDRVPGVGVGGAQAPRLRALRVTCGGVQVTAAQRHGGEDGRGSGAVQVAAECGGHAQLGLGLGCSILQPARGKGHPRAQRGRGGRPARLAEQAGPVVRGPHDAARRVGSPQVNQPGRQEQVRVAPADAWLLAGGQPDGVGGEGQRFAHPAGIPEDHGAADERSDHDVYGFLFRRGQDGLR